MSCGVGVPLDDVALCALAVLPRALGVAALGPASPPNASCGGEWSTAGEGLLRGAHDPPPRSLAP
eukprot:6005359-Pyramimonas_sp.AAC.1